MSAPRPRLSSGRRVRLTSPAAAAPGLSVNGPVIRTAYRPPLLSRAARAAVGWTVLIAVLLAAVYAVLAATVLVIMRADGHNAVVLRNVYPVGQVPADAYVYVSSDPVDYSLIGKIKEATVGVPAGAVVQIVAGPTGTINTDQDGYITVNGTRTPYQGQVAPRSLTRQYVAICIAGACPPGQAVLVDQNSVIGAVKGYLTLNGITHPTPAPVRR